MDKLKLKLAFLFVLLLLLPFSYTDSYLVDQQENKKQQMNLLVSKSNLQMHKTQLQQQLKKYKTSQDATWALQQDLTMQSPNLKEPIEMQQTQDLQSTPLQNLLDLQAKDLKNLIDKSQALTNQAQALQKQANALSNDNSLLTRQLQTCKENLSELTKTLSQTSEQLHNLGERLKGNNEELINAYHALDVVATALGDTQMQTSKIIKNVKQLQRAKYASPVFFTASGIGLGMVALPSPQGDYNMNQQLAGASIVAGSLGIWMLGHYLFRWW